MRSRRERVQCTIDTLTPVSTDASSIMNVFGSSILLACFHGYRSGPASSTTMALSQGLTCGMELCKLLAEHPSIALISDAKKVRSCTIQRMRRTYVSLLKPRIRDCSRVILLCLLVQYFSVISTCTRGYVQTRSCSCCCIPARSVNTLTRYTYNIMPILRIHTQRLTKLK